MLRALSEVFHWAGLVPLAALAVLWVRDRPRPPALWGIAGAFAVSWVADTLAHWMPPGWAVSAVYPVAQFGILYLVLAPPTLALACTVATGAVAIWAIDAGTYSGPDALIRIVGALFILSLSTGSRPPIRRALFVYFGLGAVCWAPLVFLPGESPAFLFCWLAYQSCRMLGLGLLTWTLWRDY